MNANSPKSNGKEIFKPDGTEELLKGWLLHAHKGRQRHDLAARRCDQYRIWLGGLAAALSAIVGTSVFASFGKETSDITMHKVVVVIISLLSAILTSLSTFLNLSERAEKHRSAGVQYKEVIRELERILSASVDGLTNSDVSLTRIQEQLDELEERAPVVAERIYDRVENEWQKVGITLVKKAGDLYHPKG
jgi:hypothetical protein